MKKGLLCFYVLIAVSAAVLCGASNFGKEKTVIVSVDGTEITETIKLPFFTVAEVEFFYGGKYETYCENVFFGNKKECLRSLNGKSYEEMENLCRRVFVAPTDAKVTFSKEGFLYEEGFFGREVDEEKFFSDVLLSLDTGSVVRIDFTPVSPKITEEKLREITTKISACSTDYKSSAEGRKKNVKLACERIDGTTVYPGETFSFNTIVGPRTEENGFSYAKIIVDGEFVDGIGGGVCQVSTTLFDAWLSAGLTVVKSAAHSLPVSYVPPSLDAMVSSSSDLLLRNDGEYPVYLRAKADGSTIKIETYGAPGKYRVKLRSVTERILKAEYVETPLDLDWQEEETERVIKSAKDGRVSVAYRDYYDGENLVRSEFLRRNVYLPQNGEKAIKIAEE